MRIPFPRRNQSKFAERRKNSDILVRSLSWFVGFAWMWLLFFLIILDKAKPERETFFEGFFGVKNIRRFWDPDLTEYLFYLLVIGFIVSVISLLINYLRSNRENDSFRLSLIFQAAVSFVGIIIYLLN
ncbi:MAG: hypothetical protein ACD_79C01117G0001 [uncultured bacterium]|nr:MAG: hypothetical protein ACD_79C01117G0001 [uncultured bacterium]